MSIHINSRNVLDFVLGQNKKSQQKQCSRVFLGPPNGTIADAKHRGIRPICRNNEKIEKEIYTEYSGSFKYLENFIENNKDNIIKKLDDDKSYQVIDLDESIILCKNNSKDSKTIIQIGYPFAIIEKIIDQDLFNKREIRICLHKMFLRKFQKERLKSKFLLNEIVMNKEKFKDHCRKLLKKCKNLYYLDLFNFIGDSIIDLQIFEMISSHTKSNNHVLSKDFESLSCFTKEKAINLDLNNISKIKNDSIIVLPNFIDIQEITLNQILYETINKNLTFFIVGRNSIINTKNKTITTISGTYDEILLKENINDLIVRSTSRFVNTNIHNKPHYPNIDLKKNEINICICPYASTKNKSLTKNEIEHLFVNQKNLQKVPNSPLNSEDCSELFFHSRFLGSSKRLHSSPFLKMKSSGFEDNNRYFNKKFISIYKNEDKENIKIIESICKKNGITSLVDNGFTELKYLVNKNKIDIFICMDSANSVFFTKLNKKVFTIYKDMNWDDDNIRSISGESPLGFCSFNSNQIPIVYNNNLSIEDIGKFIELSNKKISKKEKIDIKKILIDLEKKLIKVKNKKDVKNCFDQYKNIYKSLKDKYNLDLFFIESFFPCELFEKCIVVDYCPEKKDLFISFIKISPLYKFLLNITYT